MRHSKKALLEESRRGEKNVRNTPESMLGEIEARGDAASPIFEKFDGGAAFLSTDAGANRRAIAKSSHRRSTISGARRRRAPLRQAQRGRYRDGAVETLPA